MRNKSKTWLRLPIVDMCERHVDCVNRTAPVVSESTPFKMIRTTNVRNGYIDTLNVRYVTEEIYKKWTRRLVPRRGDIILTREAPLGDVGKVRTDDLIFLGQRLYHFRPDPRKLDADFLLYALMADDLQGQIQGFGSGATVEHMRLSDIPNLQIYVPAIHEQKQIGSILAAYDDLIENNTRRIAILEEMAQRIYEEWFVHFRFPGHEKVKMVDSELGKIPEGWEIKTIDETFEILGGGTPSKKEASYWNDGNINWYSPTDLTRSGRTFMESSVEKITDLGLTKSSAKLFPPFSVMMTSRATIGVIAINTNAASTNQGFITCIPNNKFPLYLLFHWLKQNVSVFESLGTGATFKEIIKGVFRQIKLPIPSEKSVDIFQQTVSPMMEQILCFERKNTNLRTTRDFLLPKLISGEIDVSRLPEPEEATP